MTFKHLPIALALAASTASAQEPERASPLRPAGEAELMAAHPVSPNIAFQPGKGLRLSSDDGAFSAAFRVRGQVLYTVTQNGGAPVESLQIRRARFAVQGNAFGEHNKYKLELAVSPRDEAVRGDIVGTTPLLDWYVTFDEYEAATLVVGQYKIPYSRQRVISSGSLQFVDRSVIQSEFTLDRDIGVELRSSAPLANLFRYYAGMYIGEGRNAMGFRELGMNYLARLELLPFGDFDDSSEADFERSLSPRLSLGASYAYIEKSGRDQGILGSAPADEGTTDFHNAESDFMFKWAGLSAQGELFWRNGIRNPGAAVDPETLEPVPVEPPRDGWGFFAQAGYLIPRQRLEIGARYGRLEPWGAESALQERSELGGVVSYYFAGHSFKLQADYFRLWESTGIDHGVDQVRIQLEFGL